MQALMALQGPRENGVLEEGGRQLVWTVGWAGAACREEEGCPIAEEARQVGGRRAVCGTCGCLHPGAEPAQEIHYVPSRAF